MDTTADSILVQACPYEPEHTHEYPEDWQFGGAEGTDPRADPRWRGSVYEYLDSRLDIVHTTQVPLCDDQALDEFSKVAEWGLVPVYIRAYRPDRTDAILPWQYDRESDTVYPLGA